MVDLKAVRRERGLTQEQLAAKAQIARTVITNIEIGQARPSVETAKALAAVLDLDWWKFFEDEVPA